jgi:DNA-binding transcriptional ArsR family regulator
MVNNARSLDSTFGALADPTRRAILASLMLGQASVSELAKPHRMSLPAVMKHIQVLEDAGLVSQKKTGRTRHCRLAAKPLQDAEEWISQYRAFWEGTLHSLERYLAENGPVPSKPPQSKEDPKWPRRNRKCKTPSN